MDLTDLKICLISITTMCSVVDAVLSFDHRLQQAQANKKKRIFPSYVINDLLRDSHHGHAIKFYYLVSNIFILDGFEQMFFLSRCQTVVLSLFKVGKNCNCLVH